MAKEKEKDFQPADEPLVDAVPDDALDVGPGVPDNPPAGEHEDSSGARIDRATPVLKLPRVTVRSATPGRVGAHEYHHEHEGGEAWVHDDPVNVALTPYIKQRIRDNLLVVDEGDAALDGLDEANRTAAALDRLQRDRAAAEHARKRAAESAHDLQIAAEMERAQGAAALSPEDHLRRADELDKAVAEHRKRAAEAHR